MYKLIDLFAGIGGIRRGFELAKPSGTKCVFTSELDKYAQITYKENYPNEIIHEDITKIDEKDIPDHDILMAGFPCQPFSQAGHQRGFKDTRGTLFFDIERIVKEKKPEVIFLENVKRLKTHDNGNTLKVILNRLIKLGYDNIQYTTLKARDFGIPQNRERLFIVAFKDKDVLFDFPSPLNVNVKVGDILEHEVDEKYTISDRLWSGHQRRKINNKKNGKGFGFGIVNDNSSYTNTISARYYKDGSEVLVEQKGKNPRKLTPLECSRLQGYPEDFSFPLNVSDAQLYKQFGNSVCVKVVEEIAKNIFKSLDLNKKH